MNCANEKCKALLGTTRHGVVVPTSPASELVGKSICPMCSGRMVESGEGKAFLLGARVPEGALTIPVFALLADEKDAAEAEPATREAATEEAPTIAEPVTAAVPEVAPEPEETPEPAPTEEELATREESAVLTPEPIAPQQTHVIPALARFNTVREVVSTVQDPNAYLWWGNSTWRDGVKYFPCIVAVHAGHLCQRTMERPQDLTAVAKLRADGTPGHAHFGFCRACVAAGTEQGVVFGQTTLAQAIGLDPLTPQLPPTQPSEPPTPPITPPPPDAPAPAPAPADTDTGKGPSNVIQFPIGGREGRSAHRVITEEAPARPKITRACNMTGLLGDPYAREDAFRALKASDWWVKKDRDAARAASGDWAFTLLRDHADESVRDDALRANPKAKKAARDMALACKLHGEEATAVFGYRKELFGFIRENFPDEMPNHKPQEETDTTGKYVCKGLECEARFTNTLYLVEEKRAANVDDPDERDRGVCRRCYKRAKNALGRSKRESRLTARAVSDAEIRKGMRGAAGGSGGKGRKARG